MSSTENGPSSSSSSSSPSPSVRGSSSSSSSSSPSSSVRGSSSSSSSSSSENSSSAPTFRERSSGSPSPPSNEEGKSAKRKRSWSFRLSAPTGTLSWLFPNKKAKTFDLVTAVIENDLEGMKEHNISPPRLFDRPDSTDRKVAVLDNPLYVAAKVNRPEAAEMLLKAGWRMSQDRTVAGEEEGIFSLTPLGVAFEKKNEVLEIFLHEIADLEEKGLPEEKKLKRSLSWGTMKVNARCTSSELSLFLKNGEVDPIPIVLLDEGVHNLKNVSPPTPLEQKETGYDEREKLVETNNPLFLAAKLGRDEAAKILLKTGYWKITEDVTYHEEEEGKNVLLLKHPSLTPLGVAFEKENTVLDQFLNYIFELEEFYG